MFVEHFHYIYLQTFSIQFYFTVYHLSLWFSDLENFLRSLTEPVGLARAAWRILRRDSIMMLAMIRIVIITRRLWPSEQFNVPPECIACLLSVWFPSSTDPTRRHRGVKKVISGSAPAPTLQPNGGDGSGARATKNLAEIRQVPSCLLIVGNIYVFFLF